MGDSKPGKPIEFIVSTGNPSDASNAGNKKKVRSVAALKSWPNRRKKLFEQLETSAGGRGGFPVDSTSLPQVSSDEQSTVVRQIAQPLPRRYPAAKATWISTSDPNEPFSSSLPSVQHYDPLPRRSTNTAEATIKHAHDPSLLCQCPKCSKETPSVPIQSLALYEDAHLVVPNSKKRTADGTVKALNYSGDMAMITPPPTPSTSLQARADPFNCYPVPYQPWFDHVLHHMMTVYAPRGWPALKITNEQGARWERVMTQNALSEPALFYVRLLYGSGDIVRLGVLNPGIQLWLRDEAIKAINAALEDPSRACSDALILAVGRIALHENVYGDKAAMQVHRSAQKRMIEMRGGMKAIEVPELVKRLMRWGDRVMALGSGTERMLEDDAANPNFTLKESISAMEGYAPHAVSTVRSNIRISELVNDD